MPAEAEGRFSKPETPPTPELRSLHPTVRPGESGKRLAPLTGLLWLWDPRRRTLVFAAGALALFAVGMWAGSTLERRSGRDPSAPRASGFWLAPPAATPSRAGGPTQSAAASNLLRFSGQWVAADDAATQGGAGPTTADRRAPEGVAEPVHQPRQNQNLVPQDLKGPWQAPRQPLTPAGFSQERGAASAPMAQPRTPPPGAGARVGTITPLATIPPLGVPREARTPETGEAAGGGAARGGQFAVKEAPASQMTSQVNVYPIATDAAKSFAVFEGQGPHVPQETGATANSGERTRVNLGGANGAGRADNGGTNP